MTFGAGSWLAWQNWGMDDNNNIYEENHNNSGEVDAVQEGQADKLAVKESQAEYVTGGGEDHLRTLKNGVIMDTRTGKFINSKNQTTLTVRRSDNTKSAKH